MDARVKSVTGLIEGGLLQPVRLLEPIPEDSISPGPTAGFPPLSGARQTKRFAPGDRSSAREKRPTKRLRGLYDLTGAVPSLTAEVQLDPLWGR